MNYVENKGHCEQHNAPKTDAPSWLLQWWQSIRQWFEGKFFDADQNATLNKEAIVRAVNDKYVPSVAEIQAGLARSSEIPSVSSIQNGLAKESNATTNKQTILTEVAKRATSVELNTAKEEIIASMPAIAGGVAKEANATDNKNEILDNLGDKATTVQLATMQQSINERLDRMEYRDKGGVYTCRVIDGGNARSVYGGARIFIGGASDSNYQTSSSTNIDCGNSENFSSTRTLTEAETAALIAALSSEQTILNKILIAQAG